MKKTEEIIQEGAEMKQAIKMMKKNGGEVETPRDKENPRTRASRRKGIPQKSS